MATIWKYPIPMQDEFTIAMPREAEIMHVDTQRETPCIWVRATAERPTEDRRFKLRGTGHPIDLRCQHVGTFMLAGGDLVFHLFEDK